ncbi:MAG: glycosyltransferase [Chitinophagaceae bacterium]|nr:glycosyltransferase [Chitinophagaceae bacterium]
MNNSFHLYGQEKVKLIPHQVPDEVVVSVCIQAFNHGHFIGHCIDSVLMQETNFKFEILLGEDNSSDDTRRICLEYAKKYPDRIELFLHDRSNVICIDNNPTGRYNFIYNLLGCRGKYIALLDGDDYWTDPYKLQKQIDFLEKNSSYAGCFHYTQELNTGASDGKIYGKYGTKLDFDTNDTFSITTLFHTSSFVFRRDALFIPDWFTKVVSGDMALFSIVSAKGKLRCIPEVMSVYRKHEGGLTKSKVVVDNYHKNRIQLMNYLNEFHQFKYDREAKKIISFHQRSLAGIPEKVDLLTLLKQKIRKIINK